MTMMLPPLPVNRLCLCSHQASSCARLLPWGSLLPLYSCFRVTWNLTLSSNTTVCPARSLRTCIPLNGQCTSVALQRNCRTQTNRGSTDKSVFASCKTVAAAVLPPHSEDFPLQLLDFAHAWSERRDNDIHIFDVLSLAAAVHVVIKADPGWACEPRYTWPLSDLLAAIAGLFARRQPHNAPTLHTAWTIQQLTRAEFHILGVANCVLATPTPAACNFCDSR